MPKIIPIRDTNINNICRTCLQEGTVKSIYDDCANGICILEKLISCTFVQFTENDGLPSYICANCLKQIEVAYKFGKKCEEVDKVLRKFYNKPLLDKKKRNRRCCGEKSGDEDNKLDDKTSKHALDGINFVIISSDSENESADEQNEILENETPDIENQNENETQNSENQQPVDDTGEIIKLNNPNDVRVLLDTTPYKCKKCDIGFPLYHQLKEHYRKPEHLNQLTKVCPICSKIISCRRYSQHINTHNNKRRYCCEYCGRYFNNDSNLARHRNIHLGIKPYLCDFCGRKFTQSSAMKAHRRIHTGEKPYICAICGKCFYSNTSLNCHMSSHEKNDDDETKCKRQRGPTDMSMDDWLEEEIVHRQLNASKLETNTVECEICKQTFRTQAGLKTHLVVHEEKKFNCTSCYRKFGTLKRLVMHMKTHSAERPFSCHICGKSFITKLCLKNHTFLHTGKKPYSCEYCEKSFVHLGQLRSHTFIHTGDKPHVCKFCGKAFALNGNLTVHIRKHTGENPFVCLFCNKGFVDSSALKKHVKTHSPVEFRKN